MNQQAILDIMKDFFTGQLPAGHLDSFADLRPREIMKESLTVVDFMVHLEEQTGCHLDMSEVGEAMMNKNFGELAGDLATRLSNPSS
jgi:acyl carrier protein